MQRIVEARKMVWYQIQKTIDGNMSEKVEEGDEEEAIEGFYEDMERSFERKYFVEEYSMIKIESELKLRKNN